MNPSADPVSDARSGARWLWRGVLLLAVAGCAVWGWLRLDVVDVQVEPVTRGRAVSAVTGSVEVKAELQSELKSEVGGRVLTSTLQLGKHYASGEELLDLDPADLLLEISRTESDLSAARERQKLGSPAKAELANARDEVERVKLLVGKGLASESDLTRAQRSADQTAQRVALDDVQAAQAVSALENTLAAQKREKDKMTLRAPFDAVVSDVWAQPGDLIGVGAPIAQLISTTRIVEARIPEESFGSVAVGQEATVRLLGRGTLLIDAKVDHLLPTADAQTQRYRVYLKLDLPDSELVPGSTGEVSIVVGARDHALIAPRRAVAGGQAWRIVDGRAELCTVQVGYTGLNMVEIISGLDEGDLLVVEGVEAMRPGQRVRVVTP